MYTFIKNYCAFAIYYFIWILILYHKHFLSQHKSYVDPIPMDIIYWIASLFQLFLANIHRLNLINRAILWTNFSLELWCDMFLQMSDMDNHKFYILYAYCCTCIPSFLGNALTTIYCHTFLTTIYHNQTVINIFSGCTLV